jgi:hypothetical protein
MGIFPQPFIKKIEPTAQLQVAQVNVLTQSQLAETTVPSSEHTHQKN